jgi:hypothetical protein
LIGLAASGILGALELDREELEDTAGVDIEFENYEGPVDQIDSRDAIRGIGAVLGRQTRSGGTGDYDGRYRVRRIVGDQSDPRLAADIVTLGAAARVDHIENLRRILAGYLQESWDYNQSDADLLARFVTIYNAVNRGAMQVFEARYREAVANALDPQRAGLATSYREWAGQSQIVIPLREGREPGALDAVDPGQLIDVGVIEELRTRADLGIEDRKAIIDFVERVIDEREQAIEEERAELSQEQEAIDDRQQEIAEEITELEQPENGDPQDDAPEDSDPEETARRDERVAELEAEQEELSRQEDQIQEREEQLEEEAAEVEELSNRVDELYEETAEDQEALSEGQTPPELVPFVLVVPGDEFELAVVNFLEAAVAGEQTVPLADRTVTSFQGGLVVAHQNSGRLLLLDEGSLGIVAESDARVVPGSRIVTVRGDLYTVVPRDGTFYVGQFDGQLVLQRRSAEPVLPDTDIVLREDEILVQGEDGALRVLSLAAVQD